MSGDEFRAQGHALIDWIATYWDRVESLPVRSACVPGDFFASLPAHAPHIGDNPWDGLVRELDTRIVPTLTHWQHPSFFAYFPANASPPAVLGELLSAGLGVQGMLWSTSPSCTELEMGVMDWLARALGLPETFTHQARLSGVGASSETSAIASAGGGVIHSTASEAVLVAMVAARHRALANLADDDTEPHLMAYASAQSHASVVKAAMIAGLARHADDRRHVTLVSTDETGRVNVQALRASIVADRAIGRMPFFVCATLGTTGTGAIDNLAAIGAVLDEKAVLDENPPLTTRPIWLHVDGAWGLSACICPEFRAMLDGIERADSICVNPHKWLLTNFDCDAFFVRDAKELTRALSITPEYLRNSASDSGAATDFRDWQVPLGRRFRALKLWLVLRHYGIAGLQTFIREHVALAQQLAQWIRADSRFVLAMEPSLSLVCLSLSARPGESQADADARTLALMERANATGKVFLTHTRASNSALGEQGRILLRVAIGGTHTEERHVRGLWDLVAQFA